jgi:hypothetical protein
MKEILNILLDYFAHFGAADMQKISANFHDEIVLTDWNGEWSGKEKVTGAISSMLEENSIIISPHKISIQEEGERAVAICHIYIFVNSKLLKVVDNIALINKGGWKIYSINAHQE